MSIGGAIISAVVDEADYFEEDVGTQQSVLNQTRAPQQTSAWNNSTTSSSIQSSVLAPSQPSSTITSHTHTMGRAANTTQNSTGSTTPSVGAASAPSTASTPLPTATSKWAGLASPAKTTTVVSTSKDGWVSVMKTSSTTPVVEVVKAPVIPEPKTPTKVTNAWAVRTGTPSSGIDFRDSRNNNALFPEPGSTPSLNSGTNVSLTNSARFSNFPNALASTSGSYPAATPTSTLGTGGVSSYHTKPHASSGSFHSPGQASGSSHTTHNFGSSHVSAPVSETFVEHRVIGIVEYAPTDVVPRKSHGNRGRKPTVSGPTASRETAGRIIRLSSYVPESNKATSAQGFGWADFPTEELERLGLDAFYVAEEVLEKASEDARVNALNSNLSASEAALAPGSSFLFNNCDVVMTGSTSNAPTSSSNVSTSIGTNALPTVLGYDIVTFSICRGESNQLYATCVEVLYHLHVTKPSFSDGDKDNNGDRCENEVESENTTTSSSSFDPYRHVRYMGVVSIAHRNRNSARAGLIDIVAPAPPPGCRNSVTYLSKSMLFPAQHQHLQEGSNVSFFIRSVKDGSHFVAAEVTLLDPPSPFIGEVTAVDGIFSADEILIESELILEDYSNGDLTLTPVALGHLEMIVNQWGDLLRFFHSQAEEHHVVLTPQDENNMSLAPLRVSNPVLRTSILASRALNAEHTLLHSESRMAKLPSPLSLFFVGSVVPKSRRIKAIDPENAPELAYETIDAGDSDCKECRVEVLDTIPPALNFRAPAGPGSLNASNTSASISSAPAYNRPLHSKLHAVLWNGFFVGDVVNFATTLAPSDTVSAVEHATTSMTTLKQRVAMKSTQKALQKHVAVNVMLDTYELHKSRSHMVEKVMMQKIHSEADKRESVHENDAKREQEQEVPVVPIAKPMTIVTHASPTSSIQSTPVNEEIRSAPIAITTAEIDEDDYYEEVSAAAPVVVASSARGPVVLLPAAAAALADAAGNIQFGFDPTSVEKQTRTHAQLQVHSTHPAVTNCDPTTEDNQIGMNRNRRTGSQTNTNVNISVGHNKSQRSDRRNTRSTQVDEHDYMVNSDATHRKNDRHGSERSERNDRNERNDRSVRNERSEKFNRGGDKGEKSERNERNNDRNERRNERGEKNDRNQRASVDRQTESGERNISATPKQQHQRVHLQQQHGMQTSVHKSVIISSNRSTVNVDEASTLVGMMNMTQGQTQVIQPSHPTFDLAMQQQRYHQQANLTMTMNGRNMSTNVVSHVPQVQMSLHGQLQLQSQNQGQKRAHHKGGNANSKNSSRGDIRPASKYSGDDEKDVIDGRITSHAQSQNDTQKTRQPRSNNNERNERNDRGRNNFTSDYQVNTNVGNPRRRGPKNANNSSDAPSHD